MYNKKKDPKQKDVDKKTPSRTSPKGGKRGCLCDNGKTYHPSCCDGSLPAQGY